MMLNEGTKDPIFPRTSALASALLPMLQFSPTSLPTRSAIAASALAYSEIRILEKGKRIQVREH